MHIQEAFEIAAETMKGYFSLAEARPKVVVDPTEKSMSYRSDNCILVSNVPYIDDNDPMNIYAVGEEIGHFLHQCCNPDIFRRFDEFGVNIANLKVLDESAKAANFIECVGCYSGLVYVEKKHGAKTAECINNVLSMEDEAIWRAITTSRRKSPDFVSKAVHIVGYLAASKYYRDLGDAKLSELAHAPFDEAVGMMTKYIKTLPIV